jgi:hypothetical protein
MESPESWFEDFGEAELVDGAAIVNLDPDFAAIVDLSNYQVFLTSYAPVSVYVHNRTPEGFEVRIVPISRDRPMPFDGPMLCGYRVVARRKDIAGPRLEPVSSVDIPAPVVFPEVAPAPERMEFDLRPVERLSPPILPDLPPMPDVPVPESPPPVDLRSPEEYIHQG